MSETLASSMPSGDHVLPSVSETEQSSTNGKRLSVERIYQKKTQLEHILIRPDTYVGTIERTTQPMWVLDSESQCMVQRELTYTPGLYKLFDEILVNAADNKMRDPTMSCIKIDINVQENMIRIWNNGAGIPVVHHKVEKMFVPSLIFGHLLTSSNYDDTERKVTGGRNGFGAKLCNIFSKKFIVETSSREYKKCFKQTWIDNMTKTSEPKISTATGDDFTSISFYPDLQRFGMTMLDQDTVDLFTRRAYDVAASTKGVKVFLNGTRVPVKSFKEYIDLYLKDKSEDGAPAKLVYEVVNPRWEVAVATSSMGFQQVSFVNSIATTKGGKHVDYIADQLSSKLVDIVKKKSGKSGVQIKNFQLRSHMWVFINCLIENPTFGSQTKEVMTLQSKSFGSTCVLNDKFVAQASKCGIVESILSWVRFKAQEKLDKQCHKSKHAKLKGIPKLDDANDAGTKNSSQCTLILTEGDSAKSLAVAGLGVVGRDRYGVFPLRGKLLNVREAPSKQIMENAEINALIKILGLQYKKKYETPESVSELRYGKIMIMTDQDQDGSHIKGLIISFLHHNWPNLLHYNVLEEFITPIVKVFKGGRELSFYSLPEFEEWQKQTSAWHTWRIKYYKGLGTSTSKEAKQYFADMTRHRIRFRYSGAEDDSGIALAFNKNKADDRKEWLTKWMEDRKRRVEMGLPDAYLYGEHTNSITYHDFIHKELILFSNMDNERSIPSVVDGLKPGQRKVLFTCLKRNLVKEIKVAQLSGSVAELSSYHHGEVSLMGTILGLAQDFVGSNNLNLLMPFGQFGTRLNGGKDAASPRYIFTALSPVTRTIFSEKEDAILNYLFDDNLKVEPSWYMPVVPMVLINGAEGIGTGWATKIPNYDVLEVIANLRGMLDGLEPKQMLPNFRGFRGEIHEIEPNRYAVFGEVAVLDDQTIEITELPVRVWTQNYKESVLEPMLNGTEKIPISIMDYKEYHTDATVRFVVKMSHDKMREAESIGLHKFFKLSTSLTTNCMVLFDHLGCIKRYSSVTEILRAFYDLRLEWYEKRKVYLQGMLSADARRLENQARFVLEKIEGKISIENKRKLELVKLLKECNYDSDPVRAWKECIDKLAAIEEAASTREKAGETGDEEVVDARADFNYILGMPLWSLSMERKDDLLKQRDAKQAELKIVLSKSTRQMWREDLKVLEVAYKKREDDAAKEQQQLMLEAEKKAMKSSSSGRTIQQLKKKVKETVPDPLGRRVVPIIDSELLKKLEANTKRKAKKLQAQEEVADNGYLGDLLDLKDEVDEFSGSAPKPLLKRISCSELGSTAPPSPSRGAKGGRQMLGRGRGRAAPRASPKGKSTGPQKSKKSSKNPWDSTDDEAVSNDSDGMEVAGARTSASPIRAAPGRRAAATKKYVFDDSENEASDVPEEVFAVVDHGQGDKQLDLVITPTKPTPANTTSEDIIEIFEPTSQPTAVPPSKPTRGGRGGTRGRGRGAGTGSRGAKQTTLTSMATKKRKKPMDSDDDTDDIFKSDGSAPARSEPRMNARRVATDKAHYIFDDAADDEPEAKSTVHDSFGGSSSDESPLKNVKRRKAMSDSDDEFIP